MMQRRTARNVIMLAIAALSASLEAPHLAHQPLGFATAELTGAPSAVGGAVAQAVSDITGSHLGFDTNIYPGDKAMDAWHRSGEYEWVGYYLQAPCHKDGSWSGKRARLEKNGWGLSVIYVGQQTWGQRLTAASAKKAIATKSKKSKKSKRSKKSHHSTGTMNRESSKPVATNAADCSASLVTAAQGTVDAHDAIMKAAAEGFPPGSVIFLDVEYMDVMPQRMRDYYKSWTRAVLANGLYRPGIYAHTHNAAAIYDDVSDEYDAAGVDGDPPFWVAGKGDFSPGSLPTGVGHAFASAWQGALDVVRTHNGVRLPIDISVSSQASPSRAVQ